VKAILSFVLLAGIFCWLIFSGIYYHVLIMRQTYLQQEANYLLQVVTQAKYGYVSSSELSQSKNRLAEKGFSISKLVYQIYSSTGQSALDSTDPVPRGQWISIKIQYPYDGLLAINKLIGMPVPAPSAKISGFGQQMSEYVYDQGG
jgi:hypothetical protein